MQKSPALVEVTGNTCALQDLMRSAPEVSLVVEACHLEGRHERLDALLTQLEMCEKALQVCVIISCLSQQEVRPDPVNVETASMCEEALQVHGSYPFSQCLLLFS